MFRLSITILLLTAINRSFAIEPDFQKALDNAVKQYPPGDYNFEPGQRSIATVIESGNARSNLERKLRDIVIPSLEIRDMPALQAFQRLVNLCLKNDPDGTFFRLAFELNVLDDSDGYKLADRKISLSLKEISGMEALDNMVAYFNLQYRFYDSFILITRQGTNR